MFRAFVERGACIATAKTGVPACGRACVYNAGAEKKRRKNGGGWG